MTTEASRPQPSPSAPRPAPSSGRKRSTVERIIVWGVILVLLGVAAVEARARIGYGNTLQELEERNLGRLSTLEDAFQLWPSQERKTIHHRDVLVLKWFSLLHDYRIALLIDSVEAEDPLVGTFHTAGESEGILAQEGKPVVADEEGGMVEGGAPMGGFGGGPGGPAAHGAPSGGPGGGPAGGSGGGRRPPSFADLDENSDGQLAQDEVSGRLLEAFPSADKDADGGLNEEEFQALREEMRNARQAEREAADPGAEAAPASDDATPSNGDSPAAAADDPDNSDESR